MKLVILSHSFRAFYDSIEFSRFFKCSNSSVTSTSNLPHETVVDVSQSAMCKIRSK